MVLATVCAVVYGTADFFGGLATRRSRVLAVVVLSQIVGLVLVVALLPFLPGTLTAETLAWGMASGVAGAAGLVLFYRALATGVMSVVAPSPRPPRPYFRCCSGWPPGSGRSRSRWAAWCSRCSRCCW